MKIKSQSFLVIFRQFRLGISDGLPHFTVKPKVLSGGSHFSGIGLTGALKVELKIPLAEDSGYFPFPPEGETFTKVGELILKPCLPGNYSLFFPCARMQSKSRINGQILYFEVYPASDGNYLKYVK